MPFWREQGLSGEARSAVGPMAEIHDASAQEGNGALFGFLGVPAQVRRQMPQADLISHCRSQFVRLFGQRAAKPEAERSEEHTSEPQSLMRISYAVFCLKKKKKTTCTSTIKT